MLVDLSVDESGAGRPDPVTELDGARRLDAAGDRRGAEAAFHRVLEGAVGDPGLDLLRARALVGLAALCRYDGRLEEATDRGAAALDLARRIDDAGIVAEVATEVTLIDLELGDLDAAAARAELAVVNALVLPDPRQRDAAVTLALQARAAVWRQVGDLKAAQRDLLEAQGRAKRGFSPESLELAAVLSDLGVVRKFAGDFAGSAVAHRRALGMIQRVGGLDHPDLANVEHDLGALEFARGNLAAAADHGRRSVRLHARTLGEDHVVTALDRVALAAILDRSAQRDEARLLLLDALPIIEERLGPEHREVAVVYNNLAAIAQRDGDLDEAERWYLRSLAIKERASGPDAPSLANTLVNLAEVRRARGHPDEAAELLQRAIAILEPAVSTTHPTHPTLAIARRYLTQAEAASGHGLVANDNEVVVDDP